MQSCQLLTHVSFVLKSVFTSPTMKVRRALAIEDAMLHHALLGGSVPLKALLVDRRIFAMVVRVHLNVARADVSLVAFVLNAVIVRLLAVMLAVAELNRAIVRRSETQKTEILCVEI